MNRLTRTFALVSVECKNGLMRRYECWHTTALAGGKESGFRMVDTATAGPFVKPTLRLWFMRHVEREPIHEPLVGGVGLYMLSEQGTF